MEADQVVQEQIEEVEEEVRLNINFDKDIQSKAKQLIYILCILYILIFFLIVNNNAWKNDTPTYLIGLI